MAVDVTNFETEVLVPSRDTPVLVDFWAPWCGPCKMLTPILEKLESEADGRWILAKVNTEEQQELAMRFEVSSIPDVRLFHDEKEIDSFLGQLPATEIKGWLEKTLPSPHKETLKEARVALNEDDTKTAAQKAEIVLDAEPDNNEARVVLAEAQLRDDATAALKTLEPILEGHPQFDRADILRQFAQLASPNESKLPEGDLKGKYLAGTRAVRKADYSTALEAFIGVLEKDRDYANGAAKDACKTIIRYLGIRHPITEEYYRAYTSLVNA
ncbi:MAG: thioredoxin [Verrucomicrobiota bacterium]|jgi:putative thioredoxin|nr:thioredoxin [Verrucomicrobiota bacterium]